MGEAEVKMLKGTTGYCMQALPLSYFSKILVHRPSKVLSLDLTASLRSVHFLLGPEIFLITFLGRVFKI